MSHLSEQQPSLLKEDQALIPESYKKTLQSKALLSYIEEDHLRKMYDRRQKIDQKIKELQFSKQQSSRHLYEQELKRQQKEQSRSEYSKAYDQMISERKEKERQDKQRELWLERNLLHQDGWLKDQSKIKQMEKAKKMDYARELEKHLKMQEERRLEDAQRVREQRDRVRQEAELKNQSRVEGPKPSHPYDFKNMPVLGVKDTLNWSQHNQLNGPQAHSQPLTPRLDRILKDKQHKYFEKVPSMQYKNENERRYFQHQNPQFSRARALDKPQSYNPIVNPIPHYYRNPNVLRFISQYS